MKIYLQCWFNGRITISYEIDNIKSDFKIVELLNVYYNNVVKLTNPQYTWEYCLPNMRLCGRNDVIYENDKTLADYGIYTETAFTVLCGFSY